MGLLTPLGQGQGYLKAGFLGFQKSGKTYTATELAIGTRKHFGLAGPLAFFDTEGGSEYIAQRVKQETGQDLLGVRTRSFDDMIAFAHECVARGVSVAIVDSVTHTWRELCEAYLKQVNERRARFFKEKNWKFTPQRNLEFQDWGPVKKKWNEWTDLYLNSPLHMIVCGRAAFEYDFEENDDGKKELIKTGVKMRAEGEFGFESALLVEMERAETQDAKGRMKPARRATILGDRFGVIDGATCLDPTFKFFLPHVALLKPGIHAPVDTTVKTDTGADEEGGDAWARERKARTILCEEIQGELLKAYPGQTAHEKKAKADLLDSLFNTRSWTAVEGMDSQRLRAGLAELRTLLSAAAEGAPVPDGEA